MYRRRKSTPTRFCKNQICLNEILRIHNKTNPLFSSDLRKRLATKKPPALMQRLLLIVIIGPIYARLCACWAIIPTNLDVFVLILAMSYLQNQLLNLNLSCYVSKKNMRIRVFDIVFLHPHIFPLLCEVQVFKKKGSQIISLSSGSGIFRHCIFDLIFFTCLRLPYIYMVCCHLLTDRFWAIPCQVNHPKT